MNMDSENSRWRLGLCHPSWFLANSSLFIFSYLRSSVLNLAVLSGQWWAAVRSAILNYSLRACGTTAAHKREGIWGVTRFLVAGACGGVVGCEQPTLRF
jgi:hypothetical protein